MTYEKTLAARTDQWFKDSQTNDQEEWDRVFDLYAADVEAIQIDFNHPPQPPRRRP